MEIRKELVLLQREIQEEITVVPETQEEIVEAQEIQVEIIKSPFVTIHRETPEILKP